MSCGRMFLFSAAAIVRMKKHTVHNGWLLEVALGTIPAFAANEGAWN